MSATPRRAQPARHSRPRSHSRGQASSRAQAPAKAPAVSALDAALTAAQLLPEPPSQTFAELGIAAPMVRVLSQQGILAPFAIQARALPDALAGRDVLARAQTGSGKTLAFGLPLLGRLSADAAPRRPHQPRGLVLTPTRELARQVAGDLEPLARSLGMRVTTVYGGAPIGRQIEDLRRGVDLVVATPGRLIDLMERGAAQLSGVQIAVLDEADHMADLGFMPAVTQILDATPSGRQCLLFSATLDRGVDRLVTRYLSDPAIHAVAAATARIETMDHRVFEVDNADKLSVAAEMAARPARTLFFVRTKHGADRLAKQLSRRGIEAAAIHGNLNQNQRQRALDGFATGRSRVLVATDVAARGLHIEAVDLVVHYDPPNDHKDYLHRSGRTARAGATGTVVSLVEPHQTKDVARIHAAAAIEPERSTVSGGHPAVRLIADSGEPIVVQRSTQQAAPQRSSSSQPVRHRRPRRAA